MSGFMGYDCEFIFDTSWDWLMPVVEKIRLILQDNDLYNKAKDQWEFICVCLSTVE